MIVRADVTIKLLRKRIMELDIDNRELRKQLADDDPNTTAGWDWLSKFTQIPVEHIEIDRVTDRKSLVNVRMTASVVTDFYRDEITSFIIGSSDSDFRGVIESLPKAKFLVMYEYEKCGTTIKNALAQHGIYYCAIDDFCTAGMEELKRAVLLQSLKSICPHSLGRTLWTLPTRYTKPQE